MTPRPYQEKVIEAVTTSFESFSKLLAVLPTGAGKTCIFSWLAEKQLPKRTLILAHREELIFQAAEKLKSATGICAEIEKAELSASLTAQVVIGSIQTIQNRLDKWPKDHFGLIVCDEAHHSLSSSWQQILKHFDGHAAILGVTATPDRGDKRNLGEYYESIAAEVSLFDLIRDGFLSRITIKSVPIKIDVSTVNQSAGDYDAGQLSDALTPYLRSIARAIKEHASFRRILVFVPLIQTSIAFAKICNEEGILSEHISGESPDRKEILERFAAGKFDLLSNAMLLTEGYDHAQIDCIVVLRPTRSRSLYSQMVGRGTRIDECKENLLLLDMLWMHTKHNLIRPAHLVAKSDEEAQLITKIAEERSAGGESQEELDLEGLALDASHQRHEALRRQLENASKKKGKLVDAMEWCLRMGADDVADYEPTMKWESSQVSEKQAKLLKRMRVDLATVTGKGHASKLIDVYMRSQKLTLASEAQRKLMARMGHPCADKATQEQAREFFAKLNQKRTAA